MKWITREKVKVDRVACPWLMLAGTGERLWLGFAPKYLETLGAGVLVWQHWLALVVGAFLFLAWSALSLPATFSVVASSLFSRKFFRRFNRH